MECDAAEIEIASRVPNVRPLRSILYFTTIDLSRSNGPGINEREFWLSLHERYHLDARAVIPRPAVWMDETLGTNVRTFSMPRSYRHPLGYLWRELSGFFALRRAWKSGTADFIVTRPQFIPLGFALFVLLYRPTFALRHITGRVSDFATGERSFRAAIGYFFAFLDRGIYRFLAARALCADACTQEHMKSAIRNLGFDPRRVTIRDNIVNTNRFFPADRDDARRKLKLQKFKHIIGYAGGAPYKDCGDRMVHLAERILTKFPDTGVVLVGGDRDDNRLRNEIARRQLQENFVLAGVRPYDEIPLYINTFDVGIAFDRVDRHDTVGSSHQKIRQYLACGVPVLASGLTGNDFLEEADLGTRIDTTDDDTVYAAICRWLSLPVAERVQFRRRAAQFARDRLSAGPSLVKLSNFWSQQYEARACMN